MTKYTIERADQGLLIHTDNGFLPGHYQDEKAIRYALEFSRKELKELANILNDNPNVKTITYEMLQDKARQRQ